MVNLTKIKIPSASIKGSNPFPDINNVSYIHAKVNIGESLSEDERKYIGCGMLDTLIPYKMQDYYDRDKKPIEHTAVVLENAKLKAVFLPKLGGRLWSLTDKSSNRELLYTNTVYQPANFALRNAWFSGGVEFNLGIKGHSPLTVSPMFCDFSKSGDAVRLYEFERIRGLSYSITAYLPDWSDTLFIRSRVENSTDDTTSMYWWSNIAYPETPDTRVIVPTDDAIGCLYRENGYSLDKTSIPITTSEPVGTDVSYPSHVPFSADYFYKIPDCEDKWIAAVGHDGKGLLQYSNKTLKGRKLFLWGNSVGGRHWNEFLSEEGQSYIEIQAGLANTQQEHIPMPAHEVWEWTEGYTMLNSDHESIHGDYNKAIANVKAYLATKKISPDELQKLDFPTEFIPMTKGSGWAALEECVRIAQKKSPLNSQLHFPYDKNDTETSIWHKLLNDNVMPYISTDDEPISYVIGDFWIKKLEDSLKNPNGKHWHAYLQLGVTQYAAGLIKDAEFSWKKSIECEPSLWAYRNLSALYQNEYKDKNSALMYMEKALHLNNSLSRRYFCVEYAKLLILTGNNNKWLQVFDTLSDMLKSDGRLLFFKAQALLNVGRAKEANDIINDNFIMCDVKEGELSLSKLWFDIYEKLNGTKAPSDALPPKLDFRMH